jgi:hypothetical protein
LAPIVFDGINMHELIKEEMQHKAGALEDFSYRNPVSILVFEAKVIHLQKTELFANLVKKYVT